MASYALVDTNVILDILNDDETWASWSIKTLEKYSDRYLLAINPIIYAELSVGYETIEALDKALDFCERLPLPFEAGFLAGKAFLKYISNKGERKTPMPDFYIGAHAVIHKFPLITRDVRCYQTYFPDIELVKPDIH